MSSDGAAHLDVDGVRRIFNACTSSSIITSDHANAHENRKRKLWGDQRVAAPPLETLRR
jgi:hypothetical protein